MIATCVPQEELGKVYALIATAECIVPLGVSQAYASLFKATKNTFPGAVFFVSCYLILATIILVLWITVMLKGRRLSQVIVKEEEPEKGGDDELKKAAEVEEAIVSRINAKAARV